MTSQINPNNIDGNYPVAGVPNNTQGMRDNFTETRTNFQYAADEITELQNKVVLKQALTGGTLDNDLNDNVLHRAVFRDIGWTLVNIPATSGTITLDYSAGQYQQINPTGPCTLAFTNVQPAGVISDIFFGFNVTNVAQTLTLPASVSQGLFGIEGISPGTAGVTNTITFGRTGNFTFELITPDGGATWYLYDLSRPRNKFFGNVVVNNDTAAVSTATGALIVDGGVGVGGNLYVGGDIVGNITITGVSVAGNVVGGNINTAGLVSATGNVNGGNVNVAGLISVAGNVNAGNIVTVDMNLTGNIVGTANVTGNVRAGNVTTTGIMSASGNITGGNIRAIGKLITAGTEINTNVDTSGNIDADGYISAVGNVTGGNLVTAGLVTVTGNITAGNITSAGQSITTGNITGGNITTGGLISATGNIIAGNVNSYVTLPSGTTAKAPLVFTSGTILTTAAPGAMNYDGTVFYLTPQGQERGLIRADQIWVPNSDYTITDQTAVQSMFGVGTDVSTGTRYGYRILSTIYKTANNITLAYALGGTATLARHTYQTLSTTSSTLASISTPSVFKNIITTGFDTGVTITAALNSTGYYTLQVNGTINVTTGGTWFPQIGFSGLPGAGSYVAAGSSVEIWPIGPTGSDVSIGNWA